MQVKIVQFEVQGRFDAEEPVFLGPGDEKTYQRELVELARKWCVHGFSDGQGHRIAGYVGVEDIWKPGGVIVLVEELNGAAGPFADGDIATLRCQPDFWIGRTTVAEAIRRWDPPLATTPPTWRAKLRETLSTPLPAGAAWLVIRSRCGLPDGRTTDRMGVAQVFAEG